MRRAIFNPDCNLHVSAVCLFQIMVKEIICIAPHPGSLSLGSICKGWWHVLMQGLSFVMSNLNEPSPNTGLAVDVTCCNGVFGKTMAPFCFLRAAASKGCSSKLACFRCVRSGDRNAWAGLHRESPCSCRLSSFARSFQSWLVSSVRVNQGRRVLTCPSFSDCICLITCW